MGRKAYIAKYPDPDTEVILATDSYWSPMLSEMFDTLVITTNYKLQGWYADREQVVCMAHRWVIR